MNGLAILEERGFIKQVTDRDALEKRMQEKPITFYAGVDPTGRSLHIGHMVPFFAMSHLQSAGHKPVVVVGGGTGMIGDPSGKTEMRKMLTLEQIRENSSCIKNQLSRVLDFSSGGPSEAAVSGGAVLVNNYDWLGPLNYLEFLRDIGRHFSVNRMLSFESYKLRLEKGLSFIEFNYQLLQSYDFLRLFKDLGCELQIGGDDQWGNIVAGTELIRRVEGGEAWGLTFHLVTRSDGKKMGKTEKGAIFLDPALTSPYEFYQYWRNVTDEDVVKFLKLFTFLPVEEIDGFASCRDARINQAKELLAYEQTRIIHGREEAEKARRAARAAFDRGAGVPQSAAEKEGIPGITVSRAELEQGIGAVDLFARTSLCSSRAEVRRLITGGGAAAGNRKIDSIEAVIDLSDLVDGEILLKAGKKRCFRVMVE